MKTPIWELRFRDGRGASFYTTIDVSADVGRYGATRVIPVAADVSDETPVADARRCLESGDVIDLTCHMGAIAYIVLRQ